jgi:esterase/lipase superfamily enzyme
VTPASEAKWRSECLGREVGVATWGHAGLPVLLFPTAGGDAREVERFGLVEALAPLVEAGWIRVLSCDSVPGRALLGEELTPEQFAGLLYRFDVFVYHELVPWFRAESGRPQAELVVAGASLGALFALVSICRHPDAFAHALCLSGKYDFEDYFEGAPPPLDFHYASPLHFLPYLDDPDHLALLRRRFVRLICGRGRAERPEYAFRVAQVLGAKAIPNRVDVWDHDWHHDWASWRAALPIYVSELVSGREARMDRPVGATELAAAAGVAEL